MKFKNLIFDLDGTLIDSAGEIKAALGSALQLNGTDRADLSSVRIGPPLEDMVSSVLSLPGNDSTVLRVCADFRTAYDASEFSETLLYPGVETVLRQLRQAGARLFIATLKRSAPTFRLLDVKGLSSLFEMVVCVDYFPNKKLKKSEIVDLILQRTALKCEETVMIGDTTGDIQAAHSAGISSIAVFYGYESCEKLLEAKPHYSVRSAQEILALV